MNALRRTALYDMHLRLGAKMTAFAGYEMPLQYRGILHEHRHCRNLASLFDISHMGCFQLTGDKAAAELENLTAGGITALKPGRQKYTVLTNESGGVIDDIVVGRVETGLFVVVNAAGKEKVLNHLRLQMSVGCEIRELSEHALLALQGPAAANVLAKLCQAPQQLKFMRIQSTMILGTPCLISRSGYCGEDGFEIALHNAHAQRIAEALLADPDVEAAGLGARDTLRLEAGLCLYGNELSESISPIEANLQWLFKPGHRDFPGARTILGQIRDGAEVVRAGLSIAGKIPIRKGHGIYRADGSEAGYITSGGFSPTLNKPIAMAMLKKGCASIGAELFARVRDSIINVTVCPLPFVPHRYHG